MLKQTYLPVWRAACKPAFRMTRPGTALLLLPALVAIGCGGGPAEAPPAAAPAKETITIPKGAVLKVRLSQAIDAAASREGDPFTATLDNPVLNGIHVAIPKGTLFTGRLVAVERAGRLRGRAALGLTLETFELDGATYKVATAEVSQEGVEGERGRGGLIGGVAKVGSAVGAIAGGAGRRNVRLPAGTLLLFTLEGPLAL